MSENNPIETIIVDELNNHSLGYNEIHKAINKNYRTIARGVFAYYIKKLQRQSIIYKPSDPKKGKKGSYSLTDSAKREYRLRVLGHKSKIDIGDLEQSSKERRLFLHFLLLFFIHRRRESRRLENEQDLDNLLATLHASTNDLAIEKEENTEDNYRLYREKRICFKTISGVTIFKFEQRDSTDISQDGNITCQYFYSLPGFSLSDVLPSSNRALEYIDFTEEEVKEALASLVNEGLLHQVLQFRNEAIFMIDTALLDLLKSCAEIYDKVYLKIVRSWKLKRPEEHEIRWLQVFTGRQEADKARLEAYQDRHSIGKNEKHRISKEIEVLDKEIRNLTDNLRSLIDSKPEIKKYEFPVLKLLDLFYLSVLEGPNIRASHPL